MAMREAIWALPYVALLSLSCGGTRAPATDPHTRVTLRSDDGDPIGGGGTFSYNQANATISLEVTGGLVAVSITGAASWKGTLLLPGPPASVTTGMFTRVTRYPYHPPELGGMDWSSQGRTCSFLGGWFAIDAVTYASGVVTAIDLRFEQYCAGSSSALHGQIHWLASDAAVPPRPVEPPPAGLWTPTGFDPPPGNFVHLETDAGNGIGAGMTYDYTQANATLGVSGTGNQLRVDVTGDEAWGGEFQAMSTLTRLEPGYYGDLLLYPFHDLLRGGLSWSGDGTACNSATGWFVVDAVTYSGSELTSIDLRFEQRCDFPVPLLHGQIHWAPGDTTSPPGPEYPPPAGLWTPAAFTPPTGNYVHLESEVGAYIGAGATYDYTQATAIFNVQVIDGYFRLNVISDVDWTGYFMAMSTLTRLEPGYYGHLKRFLNRNPLRGGLDWFGAGRGCNTLTGWFVVDAVTYAGSTLTSIDLRFEEHCEGQGPALHGQIHWDSSDTTAPPGPVYPAPAGLWAPVGFTPPPGNYVHLESDAGDHIGGGVTRDYSTANAAIAVGPLGWSGHLVVDVNSAGVLWSGDFVSMLTRPRFEPGYYGSLRQYPFHNPVQGGLGWSGDGRACGDATGWFVVDSVTYSGSTLTAIDLRFEQHCAGGAPALHGQVHWVGP